MAGRRIVMIQFSPKTGNKSFNLIELNVYGNPIALGLLKANPDRQTICDYRNVDWFSAFLILSFGLLWAMPRLDLLHTVHGWCLQILTDSPMVASICI